MANKLTAKTKNFANNKSHANNKTKRVQNLNYQKVTINGITIKTTTREARKGEAKERTQRKHHRTWATNHPTQSYRDQPKSHRRRAGTTHSPGRRHRIAIHLCHPCRRPC